MDNLNLLAFGQALKSWLFLQPGCINICFVSDYAQCYRSGAMAYSKLGCISGWLEYAHSSTFVTSESVGNHTPVYWPATHAAQFPSPSPLQLGRKGWGPLLEICVFIQFIHFFIIEVHLAIFKIHCSESPGKLNE